MAQKDLFDDSTMTFGEHLEVLRIHLWKAIVGLVIGSVIAFYFSRDIILEIQKPVALVMEQKFGHRYVSEKDDVKAAEEQRSAWEQLTAWWSSLSEKQDPAEAEAAEKAPDESMLLRLDVHDVARELHAIAPDHYPELPADAKPAQITISLANTPFGKMIESMRTESLKPRTDGVDEAFMIYLKVSLIVGVVISSPWIFYQIWQFVAAGLYPTERKYVYKYLPYSIGLFLGGAFFCFYLVIPRVLDFLFGFNAWLDLRPEIKISTWITFSLVVSLMFGVSFQLPLIMVLLDRISLVSVKIYREKRRFAILIIAIISVVLTPSDPVSMMMMMIPLCILYELGIMLCVRSVDKSSPFETQAV